MKQTTKAFRIDELRAKETETKTAYEAKLIEVAGLQERLDNPLAADTAESLGAVDEKLRVASRDLALRKRDYETAAAIRAQAEQDETAEQNQRRRQDLQRRLDEAVNAMPAEYRRHAHALLSLVTTVHQLDRDILEFNKGQAPDGDFLKTFEQLVRWPALNERGLLPFIPVPLADEFEIAALQPGDNFRVPGTFRPGGGLTSIWYDGTGRPRHN
jgi:hypothetical protein